MRVVQLSKVRHTEASNRTVQRLPVAGATLLAALILAFSCSPPAHALLQDGRLDTLGSDVGTVGSTLQTDVDQVTSGVNQVGSQVGLPSVSSPQLPTDSQIPGVGGIDDLPIVGGSGGGSSGGGGGGGGASTGTAGAGGGGGSSAGGSASPGGAGASSATADAPDGSPGAGMSLAARQAARSKNGSGSGHDGGKGASARGSGGLGNAGTSGRSAATDGDRKPFFVTRLFQQVPMEYRIALAMLALISLIFAFISAREHRRSRQARRDAMRDSLTGLANRHAFEVRFLVEWKRAERYKRPLGVLLFDLDGFKEINDSRGHAEGDRVLKRAAEAIEGRGLRSSDLAARLGGDEFVLLCPETGGSDLEQLTASIERSFADIGVEVSIGFAEREADDPGPASVLERADASMYRRKADRRASRTAVITDGAEAPEPPVPASAAA
jgi:diguanylate cyclase (GGDEF)-like protein